MSGLPSSLDISVVTYNSARWLDAFFDSLLAQKYPLAQIALHLRDHGSSDQTLDRLRRFESQYRAVFRAIHVSQGPNIGFGRGHNSHLAQCTSDFVLVTNVDLEFEPETLVTLTRQALADGLEVVSWECRQKPFEHPKDYHPVTGETLWSSSACVLLRTQALREVGGYEPMLFLYGEDVELSYRLRDHGYRLKYVPKATVWHHTYETPEQVKPQQFLGSTLANVLLRCRYGRWPEVLMGFAMFLGLFLVRPQFPRQRWKLLGQGLKLLVLAPRFLLSRRKSSELFPFRMWDYAMVREGAFYAYPAPDAASRSPLVSVVVRTLPGCAGRLREAVASVCAQTYPNIQLVLVEDGGETARDFVAELQREGALSEVGYVPLPKSGRCLAGNAGLAQAKGELICFLDDDDLFYADHLEVLVAAWCAQPELGAVYGLAYEVRTEVISQEPWRYRDLVHSLHFRQAFNRYLLWHHNYLPIQTVLFRRDLYEQYGGFDPELDNLEDWNLWVRYSLHHDFLLVPKVTSLYRVPAQVAQATARQQKLDDHYALAQAKHAQLQLQLSPTEVVEAAKVLGRELYVGVIAVSTFRRWLVTHPLLRHLYHPAKRAWALWRAIRSR